MLKEEERKSWEKKKYVLTLVLECMCFFVQPNGPIMSELVGARYTFLDHMKFIVKNTCGRLNFSIQNESSK